MTRSEVEKVLRIARAYAAEQVPWFAPALYAARLVITDACPFIAAVDDRMRVYFNPIRVTELCNQSGEQAAIRQLAWVWVHEICHRLREHSERCQERDATLWNIAADLEINDAQWQGLDAPLGILLPENFHLPCGKLAEFYYDELQKQELPIAITVRTGTRAGELQVGGGWGVHGQQRAWELPDEDAQAPSVAQREQEVIRRTVAESIVQRKSRGDMPLG